MSTTSTSLRLPADWPKTPVADIKAGSYLVDEWGYLWRVVADYSSTKSIKGMDGIEVVMITVRPIRGATTQLIEGTNVYVLPPGEDRKANIFTITEILSLVQ